MASCISYGRTVRISFICVPMRLPSQKTEILDPNGDLRAEVRLTLRWANSRLQVLSPPTRWLGPSHHNRGKQLRRQRLVLGLDVLIPVGPSADASMPDPAFRELHSTWLGPRGQEDRSD